MYVIGSLKNLGNIKERFKAGLEEMLRNIQAEARSMFLIKSILYHVYMLCLLLGECVLALRRVVTGKTKEVRCCLTHLGDESGEIEFMYVQVFVIVY